MALALLTIGLLMVIVGFQDTYKAFGAQLGKDFTGPQSFIFWIVSLGLIGSIGYVQQLQGFSRAFMALIILVIFLSNNKNGRDLFAEFNSALSAGTQPGSNTVGAPLPAGGPGGSSGGGASSGSTGGGGGGNIISDFGDVLSIGASIFG